MSKKRCWKLTREERKIVYAESETNAGAGWVPQSSGTRSWPEYERKNPVEVDREFK